MGEVPCSATRSFKKGPWSAHEDEMLTNYVNLHGKGKWNQVLQRSGLRRSGKSCRLRWMNYLRPDIKRGNISEDEEDLIIRLHKLLGNRWALIAGRIPGRTDNEIKNYWNSYLKKKAEEQKKQLQIPSKTQEKQCNNIQNNTESLHTPCSSSSAIIEKEDSWDLLLDVDNDDKWWERCYHDVSVGNDNDNLPKFPEIDVLKDNNNELPEFRNLTNCSLDLKNLSQFLGLE